MHGLYLGLDVAKDKVDVHARPSGERVTVANEEAGLRELVAWAHERAPALIVLEATGGYEVVVAATLASAGLPVTVVNPRQIRDFARATGSWPKRMPWMPPSWRTSPRPCSRRSGRSPRPLPRRSARWSRGAGN
jgi:hypothetical protein